MEHGFTWYGLVGLGHVPHWVVGAGFVFLVLTTLSLLFYRAIQKRDSLLIPDRGFSLINVFDVSVEKLLGLSESVMGHEGRKFFPLMGALFIYIFMSNLLGVIPGFLPPTDNLNTNVACSLTVFLYYNIQGFREHGIKYLKQFMGPILWLAPVMVVIELVSHVVRPISLSIRLFGNINGDHMVLGIFSGLIPIGVPIIFLFLGLFVSFIQAFVFTLLSMVYVSLATSHDH